MIFLEVVNGLLVGICVDMFGTVTKVTAGAYEVSPAAFKTKVSRRFCW